MEPRRLSVVEAIANITEKHKNNIASCDSITNLETPLATLRHLKHNANNNNKSASSKQ